MDKKVQIKKVGTSDKAKVADLLQDYLSELSQYEEVPKNENGIFKYKYFMTIGLMIVAHYS